MSVAELLTHLADFIGPDGTPTPMAELTEIGIEDTLPMWDNTPRRNEIVAVYGHAGTRRVRLSLDGVPA